MKTFSKKNDISKLSDEECLTKFIEFLEDRVNVTTLFVRDEETGNLTHQVIQIRCGDFVSVSNPEPMEYALRLATAEEQGMSLN